MARLSDRLAGNAVGDFYVDASCIDCAVCREVAPASFTRSAREQASVVASQPATPRDRLRAKMALVACPASSIGMVTKEPVDDAIDAFPEPLGDDVYFCGFASESSYGAQSYLIRRPEGNVLVDSPRAVPRLLDRIEALGGVHTVFLTHRDDVADHAKIARRFGCTRVMHIDDVTDDTRAVERKLEGQAPIRLAHDLVVIPVPGHTRGSAALLFRDLALFTGDHLFAEGGALYAARDVCWYSWEEQKRSVARLVDFDFEWVLPGHEHRLRAASVEAMRALVRAVG